MERRQFLKWLSLLSGGVGLGLSSCEPKRNISGKIVGASSSIGHLLRDKQFERPSNSQNYDVAIVGGGVSGMSASRQLSKMGVSNAVLLELEDEVGGNARGASNEYSQYPLGAHYVPIPNPDLKDFHNFLYEANVITGYENDSPIYNELFLCHEPEDRLYINGKWQEGLIPNVGMTSDKLAKFELFFSKMAYYRALKGEDGKDAFAIPINNSSQDEVIKQLDKIVFKDWLIENGFDFEELFWYTNYCTLDDFGTTIDTISAWAGIHYYASRKGTAANAHYDDVLTWEEGNYFLVKKMREQISFPILTNSLVVNVAETKDGIEICYWDVKQKMLKGILGKQCILSSPQFINARLLKGREGDLLKQATSQMQYVPWMVANLKVKNALEERKGHALSWDNVIYNGKGLGYVDASHQKISLGQAAKNLTYYKPIIANSNQEARKQAYSKSHEEWTKEVLSDLKIVHSNIESQLLSMDIALWGHAMIQPLPNWIWGELRGKLQKSINNKIHFAHTDISGVSIFEEGFYQGLDAAQKVKENLG